MKKKYQALKMYLVGLTAGLFMFGWSLVAQAGNSVANTAQTATTSSAQTTAAQTGTTVQTSTTNRQTRVAQPTFRTRTSSIDRVKEA